MFMTLEKSIINRNYVPLNDNSKIWTFGYSEDPTKQINLECKEGLYKFSFPVNDIHYSTTFEKRAKLKEYITYILTQHIF